MLYLLVYLYNGFHTYQHEYPTEGLIQAGVDLIPGET